MKYAMIGLALVALLGLSLWFSMGPTAGSQQLPDMPTLAAGKVADIRISSTSGNVHLQKRDETWLVVGAGAADSDAVRQLLQDLSRMQPIRLLTRNSARYAELGLGAEAVHLVLKDGAGDPLLDLFIGKQGTDILSTYIRHAQMDAVLAVDRTLVWQVRRSQQGWLAPEPEAPSDGKALAT